MTNTTPIANAVEPLRSAAMDRARTAATELVERTFTKLAEDPKHFAYPVGSMGRTEYAMQKALYNRLRALTVVSGGKFVRSDEKVSAFITANVEAASAQYTAFIQKLEGKVGDHTAATLEGEHVWGESELTVTMPDGSIQKWRTKQILNVSVLGKLFNQWPSRKVK